MEMLRWSEREDNRWLKSVNGENKYFYKVIPQERAVKGVLRTNTEDAAPEPPAPPVVENGRFSGLCFGHNLQEDDKWLIHLEWPCNNFQSPKYFFNLW